MIHADATIDLCAWICEAYHSILEIHTSGTIPVSKTGDNLEKCSDWILQAWVNYKRKSTIGWSIYPILLDFSGGWLSLAQLIIDSAMQNDWTGITGNPVKFGLGNITIVFDIIFFLQHYVLYRDNKKQLEDDDVDDGEWIPERERLVGEDVNSAR